MRRQTSRCSSGLVLGYRDPTRKEQVRPSLWVDLHLLDELLDAPADLVADGTDGSEPETLGVVEDPVLVVLSRVDRARVAATHRDDDVGGPDDLVGPWLGELPTDVDADLR